MFLGLPLSVVHDEVSPGISGYHPLCCLWMFEHFFFDLLFLGCLLTFIIGCGPFSFSQSSVVEHFRGIPLSHNMSPKAQLNLMFIPLSFGVWQKKKLFSQYCFITLAFVSLLPWNNANLMQIPDYLLLYPQAENRTKILTLTLGHLPTFCQPCSIRRIKLRLK